MTTSDNFAQREPLFIYLRFRRFPAQVIEAWDPRLKGRQFAVIEQNPMSHKTLVVSVSEAARDLGIHAGMPWQLVEKRHKSLPFASRNRGWEKESVDLLKRLLDKWTPAFHINETGNALLDMTRTPALRTWPPLTAAQKLQSTILEETGLQDFILGLSSLRLVARLMTRLSCGNAIRYCAPGKEEDILADMETRCLPGLSARCREGLAKYGLLRVAQIRKLSREALITHFGDEGEKLYSLARGFDFETQTSERNVQTVRTVLDTDLNDDEALMQKLILTADKLCFELKNRGLTIDRVTLIMTYSDNRRAQKTLFLPALTNDFKTISEYAALALRSLDGRRVAVQSLTLSVNQPQADPGQLSLFETQADKKQRQLGEAITRIRDRHSFSAISGANTDVP